MSPIKLRNNYVHGMKVTDGNAPVVENKGLLYNMLIEGNTPGADAPVVKNDGGTLVNLTVDAPEETKPVVSENSGKMINTIATENRMLDGSLYDDEALKNDGNPYNTYLEDRLSYQLKEMSAAIDKGGNEKPSDLGDFGQYIDYNTDRDVMGNIRLFAGQVDYGCFETWDIRPSKLRREDRSYMYMAEISNWKTCHRPSLPDTSCSKRVLHSMPEAMP